MAYIPLNKIVTNLTTDGTEYQLSNGEPYAGRYWKKYTGEAFTGTNPNAPQQSILFPINPNPAVQPLSESTTNSLLKIDDLGEEQEDGTEVSPNYQMVVDYININDIDIDTLTKQLPQTFYPNPQIDFYKIGSFPRYFCVKVNQNIFTEINQDTFNNLIKQDKKWDWQSYTPFKVQWTILGTRANIIRANRNIVTLTEKNLKKKGLAQYLKFNYTKFAITTDDGLSPVANNRPIKNP